VIVELVAVGTELLLGEIVNTNAAAIGTRLAEDGFDVHYQVTVGDNLERLTAAIRTACDRADAVVLTGGIGPTQDDMTRDGICAVLRVGIARDEEHARLIAERLAARGVVAESALRMADYPEGSEALPNRKGVALGIAALYEGTPIFAVPGVPTEMKAMIDDEVRPRLRALSGDPSVLSSRLLHCWGPGEAQIAETLDDLYAGTNPSIAFLIDAAEVRVRITAKAASAAETAAMIAEVEAEVRERLGAAVFATDDETVDGIVSDLLNETGWTVAVVEASTAGLVSARLAAAPGFVGGVVVPAVEVDAVEERAESLLDVHGRSSGDVVVAVSEATGVAEGDAIAARRVGIAVRTPEATTVRTITVLGGDERLRLFAVPGALHVLRQVLAESGSPS